MYPLVNRERRVYSRRSLKRRGNKRGRVKTVRYEYCEIVASDVCIKTKIEYDRVLIKR